MRKEIIIDPRFIPAPKQFDELILEYAKKHNPFSYSMLKAEFKHDSETTVRRYLQKLCDHDQLKREKCVCGQGWVYTYPTEKKSNFRRTC